MYYQKNLGAIIDFPSVEKAIAYIKSKVADLFKKDYELRQMNERIGKLKEIAKNKGNDKAYALLITLEKQVNESRDRQKKLEGKISKIVEVLPKDVGVIPLTLAAIAIPTATLLVIHYKKINAHQKSLELIEKGLLTPQEAAALTPSLLPKLPSIGTMLLIPGIGLAAYFLLIRGKKK